MTKGVVFFLLFCGPVFISAQLIPAAAPTTATVATDPSVGTCRLLDKTLTELPLTPTADSTCTVCAMFCQTSATCSQILFGLYTIPKASLNSFCASSCSSDAYGKVETCCVLPGVACHDPHFTGFDGTEFEFKGAKGLTFALLSEANYQLNSLFDDFDTGADNMFMKSFGLRYRDQLRLNVTAAPEGLLVTVNDRTLDNLAFELEVTFGGGVSIYYHKQNNFSSSGDFSYIQVTTPDIKFTFFKQPGGEHLNLNVNLLGNRPMEMHGVLGQTFAWKGQAEPEFEGTDEDYVVRDLFATDFKHSRFQVVASENGVLRKLLASSSSGDMLLSKGCGGYAHTYHFCN